MPDPVTGAIAGGATIIGGKMAGDAAKSAANTAADAQLQSAQIAADAQKFRPVGVTTRFGTSQFTMGPGGYLKEAGYTASPEIQALQDRLSALYGDSLGFAEQAGAAGMPLTAASQGLFGLGQQALPTTYDTTQAAQDYFNQQQALLDPIRRIEEQRLGAGVFGRGRAGLNIGDIGQPELYSLASARRQQDLLLADAARQQARQELQQDIGFGAGLFQTGGQLLGQQYGLQTEALGPFQSQFGLAQLLEQAAQQPLDIGAQLGGRSAQAGANVGQTLLQGGLGAAQTRLQGSLVGPSLLANNLSSFGQQYLQGQQQQNLLRQLQMNNPANIYSNTNQFALQSQAGMFGSS